MWLFHILYFFLKGCFQRSRVLHDLAQLTQGQCKIQSVAETLVGYHTKAHVLLGTDFLAESHRNLFFLAHGKEETGGTEVVGMMEDMIDTQGL